MPGTYRGLFGKDASRCRDQIRGGGEGEDLVRDFRRTGAHFWGFESEDVIPDIVTIAKAIGSGCPLVAVVTTSEIDATLVARIHLNTYGGNSVSCMRGRAVLRVIEKEGR